MTGHLGYESTGLNALRGQNNVQGLNDSGANPMYLPGYQSVDDPEIRRKFSEAWGAEVPETPGYRLDQMMSGLHDGRVRALVLIGENPAQTEPNARHVEEGLGKLDFLISQDIFLHDMTRKYADVVLPCVELRREGRNVHEHRAARQPRAQGRAAARRGEDRPRDRPPAGEGARRALAGVPGRGIGLERARRPRACVVRRPLRPARGERHPVARSRDRVIRGRSSCTRRVRRDRLAEGSSSRSSTSGRSKSPIPSTRSSSRPAARSTTTTRRR